MSSYPLLLTDQHQLDKVLAELREQGRSLGLVPTMGALHEGHLSLVRESVRRCDTTIATIFVNAAQFDRQQDLASYPRDLESDVGLLAADGVDLVFAPPDKVIYPDGFSDWVNPPGLAEDWEGRCRPGHFRGVCTVVKQLFRLIPAEIAFFGAKDYQQALVIRALAKSLGLPIQVEICPIIREPDGLAMSSRNTYLSPREREQATVLYSCIEKALESIAAGQSNCQVLVQELNNRLAEAGVERVEYVAIVDPETLKPLEQLDRPARLLLAAHVGTVRLIDNCLLPRPAATGSVVAP